jgi:hypothetical protein
VTDPLLPATPHFGDIRSADVPRGSSESAVVLLADEDMADTARSAVALAGQRVSGIADWSDPVAGVACRSSASVVLIETQGIAGTVLAEALPQIGAAAVAAKQQLVVALDPVSIDVVASAMLGHNVQLLCLPTMAERVAALALAGEAAAVPDVPLAMVRESEAERLQRLNEEVARTARVLAQLSRREEGEPPQGQRAEDRASTFGYEPARVGIEAADVRRVIRARRLRDTFFSEGLFQDPAWDMLLDLFAAELEGVQVSVSSLCIAAAVAPTTALRWIGTLSDAGLFERRPDPSDRRRAFMALTGRASQAMRSYILSLQRGGLSLA